MRLVAISDTHEQHTQIVLPEGDVLIHAGDITFRGEFPAIASFANWLKQQPHQHKVVIAGNHELTFETSARDIMVNLIREAGATYLQDSGCEIDGMLFWGSPWTPCYFNWAFNLNRGEEIDRKWQLIPEKTNVLITHAPPYGILDSVKDPERGPKVVRCWKKDYIIYLN